MNIDAILAGLPDTDDDAIVPQVPSAGSVRLDTAFESVDYGLEEDSRAPLSKRASSADDAETIIMNLPAGKRVTISKRQLQACTTPKQLLELDRSLYRSAGLNPADFGL
jgi:hypothetical protein